MSTFNYENLKGNSLSNLKKEAQSRGIEVPLHPSKDQLIALISSKIEPTHVSSRLLNSSSSSSSNSPRPPAASHSAHTKPSLQNQTKYSPSSQKSNGSKPPPPLSESSQITSSQPKDEEREQSPKLPSKSSRHSSATNSEKSRKHSHDSNNNKTVFVSNTNNSTSNNGNNHTTFVLPQKLVVLSYLSGGFSALFLIFSLMNIMFIIPALVLAVLFYYVHVQLGAVICQKANSLSVKISNFLVENGGEANKKAIQAKFNADRFLMNQAAVTLKRSGKVTIVKRKNQGEIWKLSKE